MTALISFLMSAGGRLLFSYVADYLSKKQAHSQEMEMLKLQGELDDRRATRESERIRLQADLNVREIQVAGDIDTDKLREEGFFKVIEANEQLTGIPFVDGWNKSIRPGYATAALALWVIKIAAQHGGMDAFDTGLLAAIAGFYFANREIAKGNK